MFVVHQMKLQKALLTVNNETVSFSGISMHKGYAFVQFTNPFDARSACLGEDGRTVLSQILGKLFVIKVILLLVYAISDR